jgi:maltooligosyltrehalose trehalohydrolase
VPGVRAGALYMMVLDGDDVPDPYARFLPLGVHGAARVEAAVRAHALAEPLPPSRWIIYELHVGTFSPEGTFRGVEARLDAIADLGVTAIELLPVAAFAGERGWGYDGVALYAPHAPYGEPEDLRALVRAAHARGLAVVLDVVYNHLGPSGNYLGRYAPEYFTSAVETPWGAAPNYSGSSHRGPMRRLALDSARHWLEEYGFDALRLDATHEIHDRSPRSVLREMSDLAHALTPPRRIFFEDHRNEPSVVTDLCADGVWADDFHHQVHVLLTAERDGYYAAFEPTVEALAATIRDGFRYTGQPYAPWKGRPRGRPAKDHLRPEQLVYCIQNHDQVGNRALGARLTSQIDADVYCAATMLLLFLPATPLLFMGQEWASSSPFLFFSDLEGALGEAVRDGRRNEFATFAAFADAAARETIPDPQARSTFERSKLVWEERAAEPHARVLAAYRAMIRLRREDPVLGAPCGWHDLEARAEGDVLEVTRRGARGTRRLFVSFGQRGAPIASGEVLLATGTFEAGVLGPRSAVVLAP